MLFPEGISTLGKANSFVYDLKLGQIVIFIV